jgi:hypothetical protein
MSPSGFIESCLPSPTSGSDWIAPDQTRWRSAHGPPSIRLLTRNGHDWASRYPLIVEEHAQGAVLPDRSAIATITAWRYSSDCVLPLIFREPTRRKLIE